MIYFRTIDVLRPKTVAGTTDAIGGVGYSGIEGTTDPTNPEGLTTILSGVNCSIQATNSGRKKDAALPADAVWAPQWTIYIWGFLEAPMDSIRDRDLIVDAQGYRYQVAQAYANILGWKLVTIREEA